MFSIHEFSLIFSDTGFSFGIGRCLLNINSDFFKNFTDFTLLPNLHPILSKFFAIMILTGISIIVITTGLIIFKKLSSGRAGAFDDYRKIKEPQTANGNIFKSVTKFSPEETYQTQDKEDEDYVISEEILRAPQDVKEAFMLFLRITKN